MSLLHFSRVLSGVEESLSLPIAPTLSAARINDTTVRYSWTGGSGIASLTAYYRAPSGSGSYSSASVTGQSSYDVTVSSGGNCDLYLSAANGAGTVSSSVVTGSAAGSSAIFTDDFSSGDLSKTMGGVSWGSSDAVSPNTLSVVSQKLQMGFRYVSGAGRTGRWVEQNVNLGAYYSDLWVAYEMDVPANYYHPSSGDPSGYSSGEGYNNKFFLAYDDNYGSPYMLQSIELLPHPTSSGASQWAARTYGTHSPGIDINQGVSTYGGSRDFLRLTDRGKTVRWVIHFKYATSANNDGIVECWATVDGVTTKRISITNGAWYIPGAPGFNKFYILGYANSAYAASSSADDVVFALDNIEISNSNIWGVS